LTCDLAIVTCIWLCKAFEASLLVNKGQLRLLNLTMRKRHDGHQVLQLDILLEVYLKLAHCVFSHRWPGWGEQISWRRLGRWRHG
jgi:hypothetical protein